jgi:Uma2 family endonuclease
MAVVLEQTKPMSYEDYLSEGIVEGRYEIIDGIRYFMTNPSTLHQIILGNIGRLFTTFQIEYRSARALLAPVDVVIRDRPALTARQPDVILISKQRFGKRNVRSAEPLDQSPELVVEILSPSEPRRTITAKMADYASVGVQECWIISPQGETVEVVKLNEKGYDVSMIFVPGSHVQSVVFPELSIATQDIFWLDEELGDIDAS